MRNLLVTLALALSLSLAVSCASEPAAVLPVSPTATPSGDPAEVVEPTATAESTAIRPTREDPGAPVPTSPPVLSPVSPSVMPDAGETAVALIERLRGRVSAAAPYPPPERVAPDRIVPASGQSSQLPWMPNLRLPLSDSNGPQKDVMVHGASGPGQSRLN